MRTEKKTERKNNFEKCCRLLHYLRVNTNEEHRLNQKDLRAISELSEYIGDKGAFNDNINAIANALNFDEFGIREEEDWRLIFDAFIREYGDVFLEDEEEFPWQIENEKGVLPRRPVKNIYYNPVFSYEEIDAIEEGILFSKTIGTKKAKRLIEKIEKNLTNKFYRSEAKNICTVYEPDLAGREMLQKNLHLISEAVRRQIQITMVFCGYNLKKELEPSQAGRQYLSPYYLTAYNGRYYLLCAYETPGRQDAYHQMYILRVDLMKDVELPGYESDNSKKRGIPVTPKEKVKNLPMEWSDTFQISHLNMAYGEPVLITLRINRYAVDERIGEMRTLPYTFLHDWFGDTYDHLGRDPADDKYDLVRVRCPVFAMENWALQYSDRVEVLAPAQVREAVKSRVKILNEKYFG